MTVLWTPRAAQDLDAIVGFIALESPDSATRVADRIYREVMGLAKMPHIGSHAKVPGTRELLFRPWRYRGISSYR
jgi:plasmid stabilization system protein ParE